MPPMTRKTATSPSTTLKTAPRVRFFGGDRRVATGTGAELGDLGESRFVCMVEEELPKLAHYL